MIYFLFGAFRFCLKLLSEAVYTVQVNLYAVDLHRGQYLGERYFYIRKYFIQFFRSNFFRQPRIEFIKTFGKLLVGFRRFNPVFGAKLFKAVIRRAYVKQICA